jgi:hypothetical protein
LNNSGSAADEEFTHAYLAVVLLQAAALEVFNGHRALLRACQRAAHREGARRAWHAAYDAAHAQGRAMTTAEAIAYAMGES